MVYHSGMQNQNVVLALGVTPGRLIIIRWPGVAPRAKPSVVFQWYIIVVADPRSELLAKANTNGGLAQGVTPDHLIIIKWPDVTPRAEPSCLFQWYHSAMQTRVFPALGGSITA